MYRMLKCNRFFIFFFFNRSTYKIVKWLNCMRAHQSFNAFADCSLHRRRRIITVQAGRPCVYQGGVCTFWHMVWFAHDLWYKCEPCQFINGSSSLSRQPVMCILNIDICAFESMHVWPFVHCRIKRRGQKMCAVHRANQVKSMYDHAESWLLLPSSLFNAQCSAVLCFERCVFKTSTACPEMAKRKTNRNCRF